MDEKFIRFRQKIKISVLETNQFNYLSRSINLNWK